MSMGLFDMISKRHLTRRPYCAALVPAAGKSERMGGTDKLTSFAGQATDAQFKDMTEAARQPHDQKLKRELDFILDGYEFSDLLQPYVQ